ncbi:MAG: aminopeptidase P N-terminal domain-containing protein [Bacteroidota bacterium]|nr:aminopeptidase P N-terminal domain-containing protein [Candidatus Kapabacteria bacterium]MDW8220979.1 aminopeptidase P N-terminal domain-containing protein [Bacteroidota bacterium]
MKRTDKIQKTIQFSAAILAVYCLAVGIARDAVAQPSQARYYLAPRHAEDIPLERFRERRQKVLRTMSPKSIAIFFAADKRTRQNDVEYEYRQNSDMLYLSGFPESESILMLIPEGIVLPLSMDSSKIKHEALLFVRKRDINREIWTGAIIGAERATAMYGIRALENVHFFTVLSLLLQPHDSTKRRDTVFITTFPTSTIVEPLSGEIINIEREARLRLQRQYPHVVVRSQRRLIAELRQIKDADELRVIRKAVAITVEGHRAAIEAVRPNVYEYELEAIMEATFKQHGAEDVGYPSIIGSGANACILHYTANRRQAKAGELILMDCGAEFLGYTADITRTVPVSGEFTPEQRAVYNLVYAAQEAALKEYRKGVDWRKPHSKAVEVIRAGLLQLGIITQPEDYELYFPHGSVHYIGLDVHDAGNYTVFQPNMVLTCEPGIYIPEGSPCDPKWWNIAVRIEDDVLITEDGDPIILSAALPRKAEQIEAIVLSAANQRVRKSKKR